MRTATEKMRELRTGPAGHRRGAVPRAHRGGRRWGAAALAAGAGLLAVVACSSSQSASATTGMSCGTTRTGANVPVVIKVAKGDVDCGTAMRVEEHYAATIRNGGVRGNGGGAPVTVDGWTCQGYPTPEVLRTGNASECHTTSAEVVAVLELSSTGS